MSEKVFDIAIIGGGIIGTATAMALVDPPGKSVVILEAENRLAAHQTGNNSGVIHSGLYYKPGSLKARNCVEGRKALYKFCKENGIRHERCGKIVVATRNDELPRLKELARRGETNELRGLKELTPEMIRESEPHAAGIAGIHVPETGIVDYVQVTEAYARQVETGGGEIRLSCRVTGCKRKGNELVLETVKGEVHCRNLINCAGLQSDRVARMCGVAPGLQIIPFRGEYYKMVPEKRDLVRNLIYPVPDPRFPFLGVHFTRMVDGKVEMGPNAVLAFKREGYAQTSFSPRDILEFALYKGFWMMAIKYWKMGMGEFYRSFSKKAFVKALQRLVPELRGDYITRGGAGVRAQALEPNGFLADDFRIVEAGRMIHVLNAPSPAATASISIGRTIAEMANKNFTFNENRIS
jgi:(S)-2-hydroxyglutarate dehydrogenase